MSIGEIPHFAEGNPSFYMGKSPKVSRGFPRKVALKKDYIAVNGESVTICSNYNMWYRQF